MSLVFDAAPPKEAWQFWQDKVPMSKKAFSSLAEDDRVKAFIVSGMARADMLTAMYDSIGQALETGQSVAGWKEDVGKLFAQKGWTSPSPYRLDNIFRTNIQTAYQTGRYRQMMDVAEDRPYWQYSAVNDSRTRDTHLALHGRVVPAGDPFWDTFYPPNGFRCRCTVKTLSASQVEQKGLTPEKIRPGDMLEIKTGKRAGMEIPIQPDRHFGTNQAKTYWKADLSRYRADVKQLLLGDIAGACPDDFSREDFAQSPCFVRLKRHLTQSDLEDLQTVVWARNKQIKQGFGKWLDTVDPYKPRGELYPVGNLPHKVLRYLGKQGISPRLALITLTDAEVGHMLRDTKAQRGATLTLDEIKQLPQQIIRGRWWFDRKYSNCLLAWMRTASAEGMWLKMAMELDYRIFNKKSLVANSIRTTGVVQKNNLEEWGRLIEIY